MNLLIMRKRNAMTLETNSELEWMEEEALVEQGHIHFCDALLIEKAAKHSKPLQKSNV